jgi:hypothetical protein
MDEPMFLTGDEREARAPTSVKHPVGSICPVAVGGGRAGEGERGRGAGEGRKGRRIRQGTLLHYCSHREPMVDRSRSDTRPTVDPVSHTILRHSCNHHRRAPPSTASLPSPCPPPPAPCRRRRRRRRPPPSAPGPRAYPDSPIIFVTRIPRSARREAARSPKFLS